MKIGIDCRMFSSKFTGIGRYTHELVAHILEMNHQLKQPHQIVLFFNQPEYGKFRSLLPVKKVLVGAKHYSWKEQTKFLRILKREACDVVHFPHFNVPLFYRGKYTVTIHDLTLSLFPGKKLTKWYHRLAYHWTIKNAVKKAGKVVAVSRNTKEDIVEHLGLNPDKIEVIYNGVNKEFDLISEAEKFGPVLKKLHIRTPFLLYTGVWRNHKNLPRLIRAHKILRDRGLDLDLVITGRPDPHYPEVKEAVKDLGLESYVKFPGLVSEKELIYLFNAASIFVFPSLYEGFGLPPLESMKCGTPVVASNASCIPEICGEENALFFDPYKEDEMADKIQQLFEDVDLQAELIEKGAAHAAKFSWEDMAEQTFKIIQNV